MTQSHSPIDAISKAAMRLGPDDLRTFKAQLDHLRKLAHRLELEMTSDGRLRFLISHAGWFRHIYSLEEVVAFVDHAQACAEVARARKRGRQ